MRKIFILGIVASGKTTLEKKLSKKMNIPWYEIGQYCSSSDSRGKI